MFAVMSMHNVVPHIHHEHQVDVAHHHHSHDDHGHHHHDHEDSEEKGLGNFLILLFAHHSHNNESLDVEVELNQVQPLKKLNEVALAADSELYETSIEEDDYPYFLYKPRIYEGKSFLFKPLRGPPSIG